MLAPTGWSCLGPQSQQTGSAFVQGSSSVATPSASRKQGTFLNFFFNLFYTLDFFFFFTLNGMAWWGAGTIISVFRVL